MNDETMQVMRADGQDQDEPTHKFLFTVDEDGNMHVAIFYFNDYFRQLLTLNFHCNLDFGSRASTRENKRINNEDKKAVF